ncbi:hypothetical protein NWE55_16835 (plasmid) [Myroides albus]|uniref:Uncharacterized protein n=1 Tax=Myroides odoratimimus TaxID=76832 RepID=A0AAI8C7M4_9FLAO|nr:MULTISPECIES: hypothetical protein [Myroides]ALU28489.1 hypothetical protein AS202_20130 [Myroides odoratimimus]UVD81338.1 hypothetical protein NWE55_16835 [Myroides albus]
MKNKKDTPKKTSTSVGLNEDKIEKLILIQKDILKKKNVLMKNTDAIEFLMDYYIQKEKVKED